ncbi:complex I assembly factor ACAD9, mitochondrial-like [Planococcus citri]|uniref:complex I assembly factor ACAD9, mitochondrial-like n=1 Tax=Planococcus citri TaxID=170843 RepID=UPI0031F7AFB0
MIVLKSPSLRRLNNLRNHTNFHSKRCSSSATKLYEPADEDTIRTAALKPLKKEPPRPPFVKTLFSGRVDTNLLAYPEVLGERRLKLLDANTEILKRMVSEHVNPKESDTICDIPEKTIELIRNLKLFGMSAPAKYGGLELTHTERARMYEVLSEDPSLAAMIFSQEVLGHKLINQYGNDHQKEKYLRKLASGKSFVAYCANEQESGADVASMSTYAVRSSDGFIINGSKVWVMNADKADVFIVFARIKEGNQSLNRYYSEENEKEGDFDVDDIGVFLVDKQTPGITVGERKDTLGVRGLHMCDVEFKNVVAKQTDILGDVKQGYDIARQFIVEDRYLIGVLGLNILRKMQKEMTEYSIRRKVFGDNLCNYGLTQMKLARSSMNIYVIESLIYFTTGLLDTYEEADCELENAITKVMCSELAWQTITDGMNLLGGQAYIRNQPSERYFRDMKILSMFDVSDEVLKMYIALCGLKYICNDINDDVVRARNPYYHPKEMLKKFYSTFRVESKNPKLYLKLYEYLHPALCFISEIIEACILRFEFGLARALYRDGTLIVNDQFQLCRVADGAMLIYAMIACISRASRSICIGSNNADEEVVIVEAFVKECKPKIEEIVEALTHGDTYVTDAFHKKIGEKTVKYKGYYAEDPLKLNY